MDSSPDASSSSELELQVHDDELRQLRSLSAFVSSSATVQIPAQAVSEDMHSGLFYDADDERWVPFGAVNGEMDATYAETDVNNEDTADRQAQDQEGGIEIWNYVSPFAAVEVSLDDVDDILYRRFIIEGEEMLRRVEEDVMKRRLVELQSSSQHVETDSVAEASVISSGASMTRLEAVKTFLPDSLLEKLAAVANQSLRLRQKRPTSAHELLGLIILHGFCASYDESPRTVCSPDEAEHFLQMGISAQRYKEFWSALSGTRAHRSVVDYSSTGWCRTNNRSTALILEIEQDVAACNRRLLYVPGATVLSLDDEHLRMSSRAVTTLTSVQQHNNPNKRLGPVGNALCSALHPVFFACHFTRVGERLLDIWQRLIQLLQGAATAGSLLPMTDAIAAADRGYNSSEVLTFLSRVLGISLIGTHKRDLSYPFVFGDGAIRARHKGMVVSERGCRPVYNARLEEGVRSSHGRQVEAVLYRESCSGRIASMIVSSPRLFKSRGFTVVPHDRFGGSVDKLEDIVERQTIYDRLKGKRWAMEPHRASSSLNRGRMCVENVLNRVVMLTFYQSKDPVWFLLRAFKFTSRTAHSFLEAVASNYESHLDGFGCLLSGHRVSFASNPLPVDTTACSKYTRLRYEAVFDVLGVAKWCAPSEMHSVSVRTTALGISRSRIASDRRATLIILLEKLDRVPETDGRCSAMRLSGRDQGPTVQHKQQQQQKEELPIVQRYGVFEAPCPL